MCRPARLAALLSFAFAVPTASARPVSPDAAFEREVVAAEIIAVRGDTVVFRVRSPRSALLHSLLPTVAGVLVLPLAGSESPAAGGAGFLAAVLLFTGPSAGHFYADNVWGGFRGPLLRGGAVMLAATGFALEINDAYSDDRGTGADQGARASGETLLLIGAAVYLGSTVYDIATAPRSARRYNERAAWRQRQMALVPVVSPRRGIGAHLAVRF